MAMVNCAMVYGCVANVMGPSCSFPLHTADDLHELIGETVYDPQFLWKEPYQDTRGMRCGPVWSYTDVENVYLGECTVESQLADLDVYDDTYDEFVELDESLTKKHKRTTMDLADETFDEKLERWREEMVQRQARGGAVDEAYGYKSYSYYERNLWDYE